MWRLSTPLLVLFMGCRACSSDWPEGQSAADAVRTALGLGRGAGASVGPAGSGPVDLPALWNLAQANHPLVREAAADVEAARGQWLQAGKYPNPRFAYRETVLGTAQDPVGDLSLEVTQEIVTGGKRRLDLAIAHRTTDLAALTLQGRQFEVL